MSTPPSIGETIAGRYELRALLRECASRHVFRAFDLDVEVEVAFWWMHQSLFAEDTERLAFERRVLELKALKHPHLIRIFDVGRCAQGPEAAQANSFVALQLGTSADLEQGLHAGVPTEDGNFLRYAEGLIAAVQGAHEAGKVHGFLTPSDVVEVAGQVKLCGVDFFAVEQARRAEELWGSEARYLAPELLAGAPLEASADWYSVALVLLELATGAQGASVEQASDRLAQVSPRRLSALRPGLLATPALRSSGHDMLAAIRLAWPDPLGEQDTLVLPATDAGEDLEATENSTTLVVPTAGSFERGVALGVDDPDEKTLLSAPLVIDPLNEMTIDESSPAIKLQMLSQKPVTPPGQKMLKLEEALPSPVRPVLRPLASLGQGPNAQQALGTLAPPKLHSARGSARSNYWIYLLLALVLGAATVLAVLLLQR